MVSPKRLLQGGSNEGPELCFRHVVLIVLLIDRRVVSGGFILMLLRQLTINLPLLLRLRSLLAVIGFRATLVPRLVVGSRAATAKIIYTRYTKYIY